MISFLLRKFRMQHKNEIKFNGRDSEEEEEEEKKGKIYYEINIKK